MKNLLLASTSSLYGTDYLEYLLPELKLHFKNCKTILFIPYARPSGISHEEYTKKVALAFAKINIAVKGIHEYKNPALAIQNAEGIFTGGGNTFLLVKQLYHDKIMTTLKETLEKGTPYLGTSAGSNIAGLTMQTTNDMPIVYPPSFQTLGLIPFNLNVHFLDTDPQSTHMGESRETRINEFHQFNNFPVLGLKEGSWLEIKEGKIILKGNLSAKLFRQNRIPIGVAPGSELSFIK
ncbi:dipeptidase PepE [Flavobacterium sufflavum]|uniref:Dipeptidase PepE n=1 Tax=Flavobacterium sufflavum TaxID=1921138 RepID=A0A437L143_9FLAO|nr:dipeptidase PepE [Flavobacterium sufflavum]RVT78670.1 dipeptidase PepE [Flavobacterium sufflavum]